MQSQFTYSRSSFQTDIASAAGLTVLVCLVVFLFSRLLLTGNAIAPTLVAGGIFFAFCSAAMIWRYLNRETVLAIRPDGLLDIRHTRHPIAWQDIRMVGVVRQEYGWHLKVYLWPKTQSGDFQAELAPDFTVNLEPLDASTESVLIALQTYFDKSRIVMEHHL